MHARETLRERIRLGIHQEIDLALPIQRHVLHAMFRDRGKSHLHEQLAERDRIGRGVFDEFETVGSDGIVPSRWLHGCLLSD